MNGRWRGRDPRDGRGQRRLVDELEAGGVDTTVVEERGMFHVYPILMPWADASRRTYRDVGRFVSERLVTRDPAHRAAAEAVPAVGG